MKLLLPISFGCCVLACISFAVASPRANAYAEPEPMVGHKVAQTCKNSMGDANSHKVLCRKAADHVVEKVAKVCHKAVKYGCTLASFAVEYEPCYVKVKSIICPAEAPESVQEQEESTTQASTTEEITTEETATEETATGETATGETATEETATDETPKTEAEPEHPSWIGRLVMRHCEKRLSPLANNVTKNGKEKFNATKFCKELGKAGRAACTAALADQPDLLPESWTTARGICKDYIIPWICK